MGTSGHSRLGGRQREEREGGGGSEVRVSFLNGRVEAYGSLILLGVSWRHSGHREMSQGECAYAHLAGKVMVEKVH